MTLIKFKTLIPIGAYLFCWRLATGHKLSGEQTQAVRFRLQ